MPRDGAHRVGPALGLADHHEEPGPVEQLVREAVHAGRGGGAGGADGLVAHGVDRADVVDGAVAQIHRQRLAARHQVRHALVGGVAPRQHAAVEQQRFAGPPGRHLGARQPVEVDAARGGGGIRVEDRPQRQVGRGERGRAGAVEREGDVAVGRALRDQPHRLRGRVAREGPDLHVHHRGQPAEPLRADAERVDAVVDLQPQLLGGVRRPAADEVRHVDLLEQDLLGHHHALLDRAADPDAEQPRRAPAGAERLHRVDHPVRHGGGGGEVGVAGLVLRAAALGGDRHRHRVPRHHLDVDHRGRVVAGVAPPAERIAHDGGAQRVVGVVVGAAHALVDELLQGPGAGEARPHADLDEGVDGAGVLADGTAPEGRQARVGEDLADGVPGGGALLAQ